VVLIATGGTISMKIDAESGGAVPRLTGAEILEAVPGVDEVARLEVREFGRYPGPAHDHRPHVGAAARPSSTRSPRVGWTAWW
jgi:hypothetical protein